MKKLILLLLFYSLSISGYMQNLNIEQCYALARQNYPLIKQYDLIEKSKTYNLAYAAKSYLPQLSLQARASWQTDITEFPDEFNNIMDRMGVDGIEFPSKDQYRIVLELYQSIWDGGLTASKQKSIKAQSEIEKQNMEVSLYAVYQQINQLYFGILLLEEQLKQNELFMKELNRNYQRIEKFIDNGLANSSDLNKIKVEILMREQTKSEMTYNRKAYVLMLSLLIGQNINEETRLEKPKSSIDIKEEINRPELKRYDAQLKLNDIQQKATLAKGMPRIGLFAQGAYANPGLNMFKSGFSPYFMGGISLSWNFSGLYTYGDENKNLNINANSIAIQKETFLFNLNQQVSKTNSDIEKAKELMQKDDEIIALREQIKTTSEVKVENGTLSVNDYLQDIVLADMARQNKVLHEMQWLLALYQLNIEKGL
ncbi:MAG: TolC family protein [Bacteroidales bacterium]|jgi:outer membrane protein TolC|nr:TolC family protein [Bacteroidales bacterium]MDD3330736.1 TolC family protein [Bacteroidales bacterium]MDD3692208.1 TolC family protein [Bacteroidales bacterium]MDD4045056.1 TolC family protein [Bacteroidales bacterium]MDX9890214.1 TolC family protein [Bacteroidales bacterium]